MLIGSHDQWPALHMKGLLDLSIVVLHHLLEQSDFGEAFNIASMLMHILAPPTTDYIIKNAVSLKLLLFLAQCCLLNNEVSPTVYFLLRKFSPFEIVFLVIYF